MSILSAILSGKVPRGPDDHLALAGSIHPFDVSRRLTEAIPVDCSTLDFSSVYDAAFADGWRDCRAPFNTFWLEFGFAARLEKERQRWPAKDAALIVRGVFEPGEVIEVQKAGVGAMEIDAESIQEALLVRHYAQILEGPNGGYHAVADTLAVLRGEGPSAVVFLGSVPIVNDDQDLARESGSAIASLAFATNHFLNARNVSLAPTPSTLGQRRAARAKGRTFRGIDWHHLVVTRAGAPKRLRLADLERGMPAEPLLSEHFCRGHFKTYTEERPLFGKWAGRFWWGPQVRGSVEVGSVVKDYELRNEGEESSAWREVEAAR